MFFKPLREPDTSVMHLHTCKQNTLTHKIKINNSFLRVHLRIGSSHTCLNKFGTVKTLGTFGDGLNESCIMG